jgi:tetratricopeptide (TPR) repeat protein
MRQAPAYYRGLAYLQNHQPELAASEFQKVIEHRVLADYPLYVVLSRLGLGRSYQLLGNQQKARDAFREVDLIWEDADPHFPALIQLHQYEADNNRSISRPKG